MTHVIIGVDESGLGAFAGPFHVAAVAIDVLPFNRAVGRYLRDSKKLSDAKRRKAVPLIKKHAIATSVIEVPVWKLEYGMRPAWRTAISKAVREVREQIGQQPHTLLIDGRSDPRLIRLLGVTDPRPRFEVEGDDKYPAIMAASILAKTARNDVMIALDSEYPEYGWQRNNGYGTSEHRKACQKYGVTKHHRNLKRLRMCKNYDSLEQVEWYEE